MTHHEKLMQIKANIKQAKQFASIEHSFTQHKKEVYVTTTSEKFKPSEQPNNDILLQLINIGFATKQD